MSTRRIAPLAAVVAGAALLGASIGGVLRTDRDLRAATAPETVPAAFEVRSSGDCPGHHHRAER